MKDTLVSTTLLRQRREEERAELDRVRPYLEPRVATYAERVLAAWERAEIEAAREYVPTSQAAALTGWHPDTLRTRAKMAREGKALPEEWGGLLAVWADGEWAFCISSIPPKGRRDAA